MWWWCSTHEATLLCNLYSLSEAPYLQVTYRNPAKWFYDIKWMRNSCLAPRITCDRSAIIFWKFVGYLNSAKILRKTTYYKWRRGYVQDQVSQLLLRRLTRRTKSRTEFLPTTAKIVVIDVKISHFSNSIPYLLHHWERKLWQNGWNYTSTQSIKHKTPRRNHQRQCFRARSHNKFAHYHTLLRQRKRNHFCTWPNEKKKHVESAKKCAVIHKRTWKYIRNARKWVGKSAQRHSS